MLWLEEQFINRLSFKLPRFKKVKNNQYSFRCPICGDSKKNAWKTRGGFYVHPNSQSYNMGCFNCGASMSFVNFLKLQDEPLYQEFIMEKYKQSDTAEKRYSSVDVTPEKTIARLPVSDLKQISTLERSHPAVVYLINRQIPERAWDKLYFCPKFFAWVKKFEPSLSFDPTKDHPRMVIPYFNDRGNIYKITGRAYGNEEPKYFYSVLDKKGSRLYGLDRVNPDKRVYVLEGPLDSLFFDNAVAVGSASFVAPELQTFKYTTIVPDNEPRNVDVVRQIEKVISHGYPICLWDKFWGKDVNDMIKNGHSIGDIQRLIDQSTVSGIMAKLKLNEWRKD
jgi:transcription elongation factor Elf1